ncbi:MAG: hypothetical protein M3270_07610 [Thermoproteota archaeon]|nr:hypothetical protein [Thermoproteota archaeon]
MNVVLVFPTTFINDRALGKSIQRSSTRVKSIKFEHNCIVCESSNVVELASELAKTFGIERVAIAKKVSTNFSDLSDAMVQFATTIIIPRDSFYVKVIILPGAKCGYVSRDLEFATAGALSARLASINAKPARTEKEATRLLLTVIGEEAAYVCIQIMTGLGGLIPGSQGSILGSVHSSLSLLSCLVAAKAGFECPNLVLPYSDRHELEINAKFAYIFATQTGRRKQTILAMPIKLPIKGANSIVMKERIISRILMQFSDHRMVFGFTTAVHPIWFIESVIREAFILGKMSHTPLLFLSDELGKFAEEAGIALVDMPVTNASESTLQSYNDTIESEVKLAIQRTKKLELEVGPNYLHDIIDSL